MLRLLLVIAAAVALVLGLRNLLRRWLTETEIQHAEKVIPFLLGSIGGFYGLIAGFMLSNSWAELKSLHGTVTAEVNALIDLGRVAVHLPPPVSAELTRGVRHYMETVVTEELPSMSEGRTSPSTTAALENLWRLLGQYHPETEWETSLREVALAKLVALSEQRRIRSFSSRERMPDVLWWILLSGGIIVVMGACVASLNYRRPAGVFLGALTGIVTLVLFVIKALDQPFSYELATGAAEYRVIWELFEAEGDSTASPFESLQTGTPR
ncbi:MAG: hypothetical protein ACRENP_20415 [Longimicrobiales bacterium]